MFLEPVKEEPIEKGNKWTVLFELSFAFTSLTEKPIDSVLDNSFALTTETC